MSIFRFEVRTEAPLEVVIQRLRAISRKGNVYNPGMPGILLVGVVRDDRFSLRRTTPYSNSFLLRVRGRCVSAESGTRVEVRMRPFVLTTVFMAGWLGFTGWAAMFARMALGSSRWGLGMMFVFGVTLASASFTIEARKAEKLLRAAILGELDPDTSLHPVAREPARGLDSECE